MISSTHSCGMASTVRSSVRAAFMAGMTTRTRPSRTGGAAGPAIACASLCIRPDPTSPLRGDAPLRRANRRAPGRRPISCARMEPSQGSGTAPVPGARTSDALVVAALVLAGAVLRRVYANQPLFADELATYWIVTGHGLRDVVSVVHTNAEISPPLFFVLSWLSSQVSHAEEWVRAPSLIAGVATIPLVYVLGRLTVGRRPALIATAVTACSPFMVYYATEARAYAVMMFLVVVSTIAMLRAVDDGRKRWWVLYAVSSCLAVYSYYT